MRTPGLHALTFFKFLSILLHWEPSLRGNTQHLMHFARPPVGCSRGVLPIVTGTFSIFSVIRRALDIGIIRVLPPGAHEQLGLAKLCYRGPLMHVCPVPPSCLRGIQARSRPSYFVSLQLNCCDACASRVLLSNDLLTHCTSWWRSSWYCACYEIPVDSQYLYEIVGEHVQSDWFSKSLSFAD